ncbi:sigma factor-like helix-turn-helix DNA-binding protein [Novosphingobium rosa]|uniref:sigma-70 region 4 domain-containing protein n=1 Tax=Novosphingobium rosa TaxID=76978 RepID=UPI00082CE884|nr:sigma-70 region 4 domain-containing protein [Novosphingobium rosa]
MNRDPERLIAALDQLPMVLRLVYLLSARDDMNYADIAFRLGVSQKEVQAHLAEALVQLVGLLDDP